MVEAKIDSLQEELDWQETFAVDEIQSYNTYLINYPNALHYDEAVNRIAAIREEQYWKKSESKNTIEAYQRFLERYPDSKFAANAKKGIAILEEQQAWDLAEAEHSIEGYKQFRETYPQSDFSEMAMERITILEENQAWQLAREAATVEAMDQFLIDFPYGNNYESALKTTVRFRKAKADLAHAKTTKSAGDYYKVFEESPDSFYGKEAKKLYDEIDEPAWAKAKRYNSVRYYDRYMKNFPNGNHYSEAERAIVDIELKKILSGKYGTMPQMLSLPGYNRGILSTIVVENKTDYTLTVLYSGPTSKKVVLKPDEEKTVKLGNGKYTVAASVKAANVQNYVGHETLNGDFYSSSFYIETRFGRYSFPWDY